MSIEENKSIVRRVWEEVRGTHKGEFMGIAPTGKKLTVTWFAIYRLEERLKESVSFIFSDTTSSYPSGVSSTSSVIP